MGSESKLVEQLFLDYSIQDVLNPQNGLQVVEPWAGMYIQAIRDGRYGDAVWARYHIEGDVHDGIIGDTNTTVLEMIEEDATEYRVNAPEQYAEALAFYEKTSSADEHANVTEIISRVGHENIADLHTRVTYSTTCSRRNLAYKSSCLQLIRLMSTQRALIGNRRDVYTYNSCRLRVGPYRSAPDLSYNTAHIVARLIEDDCGASQGLP
ncbi:hypothetical protein CDV31_017208 [Fusarium ambrosium]|uniref:WD-like domain-containing protein n=1 Tax=Fusarium ambrosium TaxID=131363 RepID=A0A428RPI3_9HYPO|nr:hypothetical protein CDV31_017208 [Fusarium ambrosium]